MTPPLRRASVRYFRPLTILRMMPEGYIRHISTQWSSYDYCLVLDQRCSDFSHYLYFNKVGSRPPRNLRDLRLGTPRADKALSDPVETKYHDPPHTMSYTETDFRYGGSSNKERQPEFYMETTRTTRIVSILVSLVLLGQGDTYGYKYRAPRRRGENNHPR
uniref:Uncharacterized protein n=1 Tax=Oryza sativa subsp. japonica TaxID=39947 RepID=Q6Z732_ORYSJ|nr:hypothetical protein [Oryza sativa Japonica Group]